MERDVIKLSLVYQQNLPLKMQEIAFQRVKISKFSRGSMPPDPPKMYAMSHAFGAAVKYYFAPSHRSRVALLPSLLSFSHLGPGVVHDGSTT